MKLNVFALIPVMLGVVSLGLGIFARWSDYRNKKNESEVMGND